MKRRLIIIQIIFICLACFWKCSIKGTKSDDKPLQGSYDVSYDESYVESTKSTTGKIAGQVTNKETKEAVTFCNISVQGTKIKTVSDLNGDYFMIHIPPGTYNVQAGRKGYSDVTAVNVKIEISKTTTVNFQLVKDPSYEEPKPKLELSPY